MTAILYTIDMRTSGRTISRSASRYVCCGRSPRQRTDENAKGPDMLRCHRGRDGKGYSMSERPFVSSASHLATSILMSRGRGVRAASVAASLALSLILAACSAPPQTGGGGVQTPTPSVPAAVATVTPSPLPSAEKLLADSYLAMQQVKAVKVVSQAKGAVRSLTTLPGQATTASEGSTDRKITATYAATPDHAADARFIVSESVTLGQPSRSTAWLIGSNAWQRLDAIDANGAVVRAGAVTQFPASDVRNILGGQPTYRFPNQGFGALPANFVLGNTQGTLTSKKVDGLETKNGLSSYRIALTGTIDGSSGGVQFPEWNGTMVGALWIDATSLRWVRLEMTATFADGVRKHTISDEYSDYDKDPGIKAPQ